jgi:hypothetical protein
VKSYGVSVITSLALVLGGNVCFAEVWKGTVTRVDSLTYDTVGGRIAYDEISHPKKISVQIVVDTRNIKRPVAKDFRIRSSRSKNLVPLYSHKCGVDKKYNKTECTGDRAVNYGGEVCIVTSFFGVPRSRSSGFGAVIQSYTCPVSNVRALITWGGTVRRVKR